MHVGVHYACTIKPIGTDGGLIKGIHIPVPTPYTHAFSIMISHICVMQVRRG